MVGGVSSSISGKSLGQITRGTPGRILGGMSGGIFSEENPTEISAGIIGEIPGRILRRILDKIPKGISR